MKIVLLRQKILFAIIVFIGFLTGMTLSYFSLPFRSVLAPAGKPRVAIVIDDFGGYAAGIKNMMEIPFPLTFAVLPFAEFAHAQALEGVEKGYEIIVHFPFQALQANPRFYGKKYISTTSSPEDIANLMNEAFTILPMAVGLNNHMGSRATSDARVMHEVLRNLSNRRLLFLDSRTTIHTQAPAIASEYHMDFISRDIFLDDLHSADYIREQLRKLVLRAREKGSAVGIGHVGPGGPELARVLQEELPRYQKEGVQFVFLSELVRTRCVKPGRKSVASDKIIGIDPGHGGIDSGTRYHSIMEKDLNLNFSLRLASQLRKAGYHVILSRKEDRLLSPYADYKEFIHSHRPYKRDDLNRRLKTMESAGASIILSIHANWSPLDSRCGPSVFYRINSPDSQRIAVLIQEELNKAQPLRKIVRPGKYYLLSHASVPAILIETGYLSNPLDRQQLRNLDYQNKLFAAIIRGLENYNNHLSQ